MRTRRVLMLGLDGYDPIAGHALMAAGHLPCLRRLGARSARVALDHGAAKRTGLAWEHVSTGRSPADAGRWSAVHFDPDCYAVWQALTGAAPFPAHLGARTVVFDPPYFDLARAPRTRGIVAWGAHDPGIRAASGPADLRREIETRFGNLFRLSERVPRTVIASPQFFAAELVRAARHRLSQLHAGTSWQAILSETAPWFESVVYFTYAQAADLVSRYHFIPGRQYCTGVWMRHDADSWSFDDAIAPENIRFCVVQSNMGLPASWTWERIKHHFQEPTPAPETR